MASSFVLTLDTVAPQITWGEQRYDRAAGFLEQDYTVSEPGVLSATFTDTLGTIWPAAVMPTKIVVNFPPGHFWGSGTLNVVLRDDVLNQAAASTTARMSELFDVDYSDALLWEADLDDDSIWTATLTHAMDGGIQFLATYEDAPVATLDVSESLLFTCQTSIETLE